MQARAQSNTMEHGSYGSKEQIINIKIGLWEQNEQGTMERKNWISLALNLANDQ